MVNITINKSPEYIITFTHSSLIPVIKKIARNTLRVKVKENNVRFAASYSGS